MNAKRKSFARHRESTALTLQLAELFESIEEVKFWIKDREGRYVHINRTFLLNYELDDRTQVIGKTDYELSPAFMADQFRFDDEEALAGQRIVDRIELVGPSDHLAHWNVTNKIPIRDAAGHIIGSAGTTRRLGQAGAELGKSHGFASMLAVLSDHFREPVSNAELAKRVGFSIRAFERKFRASFHVTPQQYLRRMRIRAACRALIFTEKPVSTVALECGFGDQSHFGREFSRQTGHSPRAYREHYRHKH